MRQYCITVDNGARIGQDRCNFGARNTDIGVFWRCYGITYQKSIGGNIAAVGCGSVGVGIFAHYLCADHYAITTHIVIDIDQIYIINGYLIIRTD